jgi:hypothetical protein
VRARCIGVVTADYAARARALSDTKIEDDGFPSFSLFPSLSLSLSLSLSRARALWLSGLDRFCPQGSHRSENRIGAALTTPRFLIVLPHERPLPTKIRDSSQMLSLRGIIGK